MTSEHLGFTMDRARWREVHDDVRATVPPPSELAWLSELYSLVERSCVDDAVDLVYDRFDSLLQASRFRVANEALDALDVQRLDSNLMVAVLVITRPANDNLSRRAVFLDRVERALSVRHPERVDALLDGLR